MTTMTHEPNDLLVAWCDECGRDIEVTRQEADDGEMTCRPCLSNGDETPAVQEDTMPTTTTPVPELIETPVAALDERGVCCLVHDPKWPCRGCGEVEPGPEPTWLCLRRDCTARIPMVHGITARGPRGLLPGAPAPPVAPTGHHWPASLRARRLEAVQEDIMRNERWERRWERALRTSRHQWGAVREAQRWGRDRDLEIRLCPGRECFRFPSVAHYHRPGLICFTPHGKTGACPPEEIWDFEEYRPGVTLLHEFAHHVTGRRHPEAKPHGPEWKAIYRVLLLEHGYFDPHQNQSLLHPYSAAKHLAWLAAKDIPWNQ